MVSSQAGGVVGASGQRENSGKKKVQSHQPEEAGCAGGEVTATRLVAGYR